jgi:hypothetical protein
MPSNKHICRRPSRTSHDRQAWGGGSYMSPLQVRWSNQWQGMCVVCTVFDTILYSILYCIDIELFITVLHIVFAEYRYGMDMELI